MKQYGGGVELNLTGRDAHSRRRQRVQGADPLGGTRRSRQGSECPQRIERSLKVEVIAAPQFIEHFAPRRGRRAEQAGEGGVHPDFIALRIKGQPDGSACAGGGLQPHRPEQHGRDPGLGPIARPLIPKRHEGKAEVERVDASVATVGRGILAQAAQSLFALRLGEQRGGIEGDGVAFPGKDCGQQRFGGAERTGQLGQVEPGGGAADGHAHQATPLQTGDQAAVKEIEDVSDVFLTGRLAPLIRAKGEEHEGAGQRDTPFLSELVGPLICDLPAAPDKIAQPVVQRVEDLAAAQLEPAPRLILLEGHLGPGSLASRFG